jgi:hypothetical protein
LLRGFRSKDLKVAEVFWTFHRSRVNGLCLMAKAGNLASDRIQASDGRMNGITDRFSIRRRKIEAFSSGREEAMELHAPSTWVFVLSLVIAAAHVVEDATWVSRSSPPQRSQGVKGGGSMRVRMRVPFVRDARSETMERPKGARLKGWIESSNALRWRFGQLLGCAFIETESSKIKIGNLPAAPARCDHVGTI